MKDMPPMLPTHSASYLFVALLKHQQIGHEGTMRGKFSYLCIKDWRLGSIVAQDDNFPREIRAIDRIASRVSTMKHPLVFGMLNQLSISALSQQVPLRLMPGIAFMSAISA